MTKWAVSHVRGIPTYVDGFVAILGDAVSERRAIFVIVSDMFIQAHAMTPHLGAGGGQAIEVCTGILYKLCPGHRSLFTKDAYILGKLLASPITTASNLPSVLKIYDAIRRPYANHIVERSYSLGRLAEFIGVPDHIDVARAREGSKEELQLIGQEIRKKWEIHWASVPEDDWKEAERMLKQLGNASGQPLARL